MKQRALYDIIVIGVGGMGSATCYQIAKRGYKVLGLEQFDIPHNQGSSHGLTRIIRLAYYEDPSYVPLLRRAYQLWAEIEQYCGEQLFYKTGSVDVINRAFRPNKLIHGSYHFNWTTADEIAWKKNYQRWMTFVNDYKNAGGRVTAGSDAGFIYKLYGFAYIRELEMLQEAGFHPLEVLQAATLNGAELLGLADEIGTIELGKKADLVIVEENPLANFKVLYGTGHLQTDWETGKAERTKGILYTIKDGVVYDAKELLADVRKMVADEKEKEAEK